MKRREKPAAGIQKDLAALAFYLVLLLFTLACAPPFLPSQAPPDPVPALPVPNIEATVEAMVTERVREALAAIPSVTPAPTATPIPTATPPAAHPALLPPAASEDSPALSPEETAPLSSNSANMPAPAGLAEMVEQVKPGVVRINTSSGVGSGIIIEKIGSDKGLVLTNYHVVENSFRIDVLVNDSRTLRGRVVGFDQQRDLAVLEICCDDFPTLQFSSAADIGAGPVPGTEVVAIGYALGLTGNATVTRGIVSAVRYHPTMKAWVIQTDASINPGNSGGPLLLPTGEVIGIATFLQNRDNRGNPTAGLGFAISERSIRELLPDLKDGARVVHSSSILGSRSGSEPSTLEWQTWTSPTHRYSVSVPQDWTIDDRDQGKVHFDSPDNFAGLTLIAYDQRVVTVAGWLDDVIEEHKEFYGGRFQLLDRDTVNYADGKAGATIVFRARVSPRYCVLRVNELFLQSDAGNFVASFHICEHSYLKYSRIQQAVLSSIAVP